MEIELWKPIIGFEDRYEVSNHGNVRGFWYGGYKMKSPKLKKPQRNKNGYYYVILQNGKIMKSFLLHRLVLSTFDKPMDRNIDCCHKNHNREDNRLCNLEWGTRKYNEFQKKLNGTTAMGEKNGKSKMTNEKVLQIRQLFSEGKSTNSIAKQLNLKQQNVWCICTKKTWKHL